MFRISKASNRGQKLIRKVRFASARRGGAVLDVTVEYAPQETLNEQMEQERVRVVGQRKYGAMEDLAQTAHEMKRRWHMILSSRVRRIEGLTPRVLSTLMEMDPSALAAGKVDEEIVLNVDDDTPISDEDRTKDGIPADVKTVGQFASKEIFYFINEVGEFRTFLEAVVTDIGYFQDAEWDPQIKN